MRFRIAYPQWILQKQQNHRDHNLMQQTMRGGTIDVLVEDLCNSLRRVDINGDWTVSRLQAAHTRPSFFQESLAHV